MPTPARPAHVDFLRLEFEKRKRVNARYSLRTFARDLEIHHTSLSRVLNSTQELSFASSQIIAEKLDLRDVERRDFFASVAEEKWFRSLESFAAAVGDLRPESLAELRLPFERALGRLCAGDRTPLAIAPDREHSSEFVL